MQPNTGGRLEVFAIGSGGKLGHIWQAPPDPWSLWTDLGDVVIQSQPTACLNADGRLEVVAASDNVLGHIWQTEPNNGWSEWTPFPGEPAIQSVPAAIFQNADGHLEVFSLSSPDGLLGHTWQQRTSDSTSWAEWVDLGAVALESPPVAFQSADGRLEIFAVDPDRTLGNVFQTSVNNGWDQWNEFDLQITSVPAVFQNADGHLEVFARATGGTLGHVWQWQASNDNSWSDWNPELGPEIEGGVTVFQNADGRLEVFAIAADGNLGHMWQTAPNNGWSDWNDLGFALGGSPAIFQNADGRLEVFARSSDGTLGHMWQWRASDDTSWTPWNFLSGEEMLSAPTVVSNAPQ